jgi:hypothetical protein
MKLRRIPWIVGVTAAAMKVVGLIALRRGAGSILASAVMIDKLPIKLTMQVCDLLFDPRRLGPTTAEAVIFDVSVVCFTFLQWTVIGWSALWVARVLNRSASRRTS